MTRARFTHGRSSRVAVTFAVATFGLAACTDQLPVGPTPPVDPSFDRSTAPGQQRAAGIDGEFVRIAQNAKGFGGMFYDASGRLNVYMTKETGQSPQARQAVLGEVGASMRARGHSAPAAADMVVLEGTRDFLELTDLRGRMSPVLGEPGVVFTDIDEAHNQLRIGILAGADPSQVQAAVERLGVPLDAVSLTVTEPIVPFATLWDAQDPMGGGLQIWRFIPPGTASICTLGFNVRLPIPNRGDRYFFTNSHCTEERGTVTGTVFRQGQLSLATRTVAVEVADPPFFTCQYVGFRCRWSDAALAQYFPEAEVRLGMIYQTEGVSTTGPGTLETLVPGKAFSISGERPFPVLGEVLDKVGRTTGWTRGEVIGTCIDTGVAGANPPIAMLCQDFVGAHSAGGDSGSPVFQPTGVRNLATLYGILWGGSPGLYVFSALENIRADFGDFVTH